MTHYYSGVKINIFAQFALSFKHSAHPNAWKQLFKIIGILTEHVTLNGLKIWRKSPKILIFTTIKNVNLEMDNFAQMRSRINTSETQTGESSHLKM